MNIGAHLYIATPMSETFNEHIFFAHSFVVLRHSKRTDKNSLSISFLCLQLKISKHFFYYALKQLRAKAFCNIFLAIKFDRQSIFLSVKLRASFKVQFKRTFLLLITAKAQYIAQREHGMYAGKKLKQNYQLRKTCNE